MASATSPSPGGGDDMERPSSSPETIGDPESPPDSPTIESLAEEADDPSSPESAAESQDQSKRKKKKKKDRRNLEGRRQMSRSGELKTATSVDQPEATRSAGTGLGAEDIAKVAVAPNSKFVKLQSFLMKQQEDRSAAGRIERLMRSTKYDVATGVIIMVDVGLNWMDIDIRASGRDTPLWLDVSATVCLAIYTIEMIAITVLHGRRVLQDKWFLLDVVIVGSGLLQLFLSAIGISVDEVTLLRILRVVRIMRLFRLFRKFRFLKELRKLLKMTGLCFKTLCWSFLFCFVIMTSWAMLAVELLSPLMPEMIARGEWEDCEFCTKSLTSVLYANLLIFKTVVAGDSWGDVAVPLIEADPWVATGIFIGSHLTIVFGVLNLVVAVVVDTFAEQRMRDVTTMAMEMDEDAEEDLRDLDKMFLEIDANNDGTLTFDELLEGAMKVREFQNRLRVMDIDQNDLQQLFLMLDHDGGGTIDPDEFKKTLSRWAFDSKTTTRFVRYNLQQLMNDHSTAATKIAQMEMRLEAAIASTERNVRKRTHLSHRRRRHRGSNSHPQAGAQGENADAGNITGQLSNRQICQV
ncbi:Cation channel sperm-associated protein 1 (CatSper1) [Durusdinium trenchii]